MVILQLGGRKYGLYFGLLSLHSKMPVVPFHSLPVELGCLPCLHCNSLVSEREFLWCRLMTCIQGMILRLGFTNWIKQNFLTWLLNWLFKDVTILLCYYWMSHSLWILQFRRICSDIKRTFGSVLLFYSSVEVFRYELIRRLCVPKYALLLDRCV